MLISAHTRFSISGRESMYSHSFMSSVSLIVGKEFWQALWAVIHLITSLYKLEWDFDIYILEERSFAKLLP